jgi:hypothetical protein
MDNEQMPRDDLPETTEMQTQDVQPNEKQKKRSKKGLLVIILLVVLLAGAGVLGYFTYQKTDRANKLGADVTRLEETIATKDARIAELLEGGGTTAGACGSGTTYTADVGKFEVTLDSPYAIIRDLDAAFEGGPATNLSVVSCIEGQTNVFDNPPQNGVSVLANPSSTAADLRASYESRAGTPLTADGTIAIGGVTADKYTLSALFETTVVYFDNDGIGYQIELADTNTTTNAILTDLTGDWSFTP